MGLLMLILNIVNIFSMLPEIFAFIRAIMDLIKLLKSAEEQKAARAQLKGILSKYKGVDKKDRHRMAASGASLKDELAAMHEELKAKVA